MAKSSSSSSPGAVHYDAATVSSLKMANVPEEQHHALMGLRAGAQSAGLDWLTILMLIKSAAEKAPDVVALIEQILQGGTTPTPTPTVSEPPSTTSGKSSSASK